MKSSVYNIFEDVNESKFPGFKEVAKLLVFPGDFIMFLRHVFSLRICVAGYLVGMYPIKE